MQQTRKSHKLRRIALNTGIILAILLTVWLPFGSVFAEDGNSISEMSLYQRASELTREFATALSPGSQVENMYMLESTNSNDMLVAGNAGGLLGYAEILADDTGVVGWLMNSYTSASATITYDQLRNVIPNQPNNSFLLYAGYGEVLTEMGLISTIRPGIGSIGRVIGTGLVMVAYLLANAAPFLFRGALLILVTLNPFKLFETVFNGTASANLGILSGMAEYVGGLYKVVQNLSVTVLLPSFLIITILGILMFKKSDVLKRSSRYAVRVFMIFAGLPLIGATYTGLVEDLESEVAVGAEYADYLVLSTYVDFENWVKSSRLAPPNDVSIRNPRYSEDETRTITDRSMVLSINGNRARNSQAYNLMDRYSSTDDIGKILDVGGDKTVVGDNTMSNSDKNSFSKVFSLLNRHLTSARYTSSDYDGEVAGQIQKIRAKATEADEENIVKMYSLTASDSRTWSQKINPFEAEWTKPIHWNGENNSVASSAKGLFTEGKALNELFQFGSYRMNIYNTGDLRYENGSGYVVPSMPDRVTRKTDPIGATRADTVGGLSPIAMYNFLNTTFNDTGLTVYSPQRTASDMSRDSYAAVTFGGTGVSAFAKWLENLTVMLGLAILSIGFGLMMLSVSIKSIPRILSGVFGTAFGSIQFITKLLISTAVLIVQVLGMIFLYTLSENIIMTLLLNFNSVVNVGGEYFGAGLIFEFLSSFMIIVITAGVTIFSIKYMNVFKEMMEEVVSNAINRVMGVLDTSTGGKGLDTTRTTGGRIGSDGHLSDDAKAKDARGITGMMEAAAGGGLVGGAASLMGQAHDIEARREQHAEEMGQPTGSLMDKLKARKDTYGDLHKAKAADLAKGAIGIDGKSLERENEAKEQQIRSMLYNRDGQDRFAETHGVEDGDELVGDTTNGGQRLDENGELLQDEFGNAVNKDGYPISPAVPLAVGAFNRPVTTDSGALLDEEGNVFTDEAGNALYQDDKGRLTDENGEFVAIDKDGVIQPVSEIPHHNGKPVSAAKEAKALNDRRYDPIEHLAMTTAQAESHYGLNPSGEAVGTDGQPLTAIGANGKPEAVELDSEGFVTDSSGNRISASEIQGSVDARGFEEVVDPETGETQLRHKGDGAMKHVATPSADKDGASTAPQSLTALARQSNNAHQRAEQARRQVESYKAEGAPAYALAQAERYAAKTAQAAEQSQERFTTAMQNSSKSTLDGTTNAQSEPVSKDQMASAQRYAQSEQAALRRESNTLDHMVHRGADSDSIAKQEKQVAQQQRAVNDASDKLSQLKSDGGNPATIAQQEQRVSKQQAALRNSSEKLDAMKQPAASPQEIDRQQRRVEEKRAQAQQASTLAENTRTAQRTGRTYYEVANASDRMNRAQTVFANRQASYDDAIAQGLPQPELAKRQARVTQAANELSRSQAQWEQMSQAPQANRKQVDQVSARYETAQATYQQAKAKTSQLMQTGASQPEIRKAKKAEVQAGRKLREATRVKQLAKTPKGWSEKAKSIPTIQPVPDVSPTKSYAALASQGITTYDDYAKNVTAKQAQLKQTQSRLQQSKQRLATLQGSNRPAQIVQQAEDQMKTLTKQVKASQKSLDSLQSNAQGLLKSGNFQPVVASRPIRQNGTAIINDLVTMNHTQTVYDQLSYQHRAGTLTENGRKRMEQLGSRLNSMKSQLVTSGIREDALKDASTIKHTTQHMQQSWDAFVSGTSVEQN